MALELDPRVAEELKKLYTSLDEEGKLFSPEQLATYYATFRSRFGPDRLKNMDGEALLETMHSHGSTDSG